MEFERRLTQSDFISFAEKKKQKISQKKEDQKAILSLMLDKRLFIFPSAIGALAGAKFGLFLLALLFLPFGGGFGEALEYWPCVFFTPLLYFFRYPEVLNFWANFFKKIKKIKENFEFMINS